MEETITTNLSLSYTTSGYLDYEGNINYECPSLPDSLMVFVSVCIGLCLCGLVGNGTVTWFLGFHVKQNPFNIYILNLAVADFSLLLMFFLLLLAVLTIVAFCLPNYISFYQDFVLIVEFLCHFFDLSSLGLLTAISVERCVSVLFPIWYRCHRPKHLSGITCGVLWALAGFFVSSMYFSFTFAENYETIFAGIAITFSMFFSAVMLVSNLSLFIKLRCGSRRRYLGKLYVAVLLNVIFFFALGIPFSVEVFVNLPYLRELLPTTTTFLMALLNCSVNPIIYFMVGSCQQHRFQCSLKVAFRRLFEEKEPAEEGNPVPGDAVVETSV